MNRFLELFVAGLLLGILVTYQVTSGDGEFGLVLRSQDKLPSHMEVHIDGRTFRTPVYDFLPARLGFAIPIDYSEAYILVAEFPDGSRITSKPQDVAPGQLHYAYIVQDKLQTEIRAR